MAARCWRRQLKQLSKLCGNAAEYFDADDDQALALLMQKAVEDGRKGRDLEKQNRSRLERRAWRISDGQNRQAKILDLCARIAAR